MLGLAGQGRLTGTAGTRHHQSAITQSAAGTRFNASDWFIRQNGQFWETLRVSLSHLQTLIPLVVWAVARQGRPSARHSASQAIFCNRSGVFSARGQRTQAYRSEATTDHMHRPQAQATYRHRHHFYCLRATGIVRGPGAASEGRTVRPGHRYLSNWRTGLEGWN